MGLINKMLNNQTKYVKNEFLYVLYIKNNVIKHVYNKYQDEDSHIYNTMICGYYGSLKEEFDDFAFVVKAKDGYKTLKGDSIILNDNKLEYSSYLALKEKGFNIQQNSKCWAEKANVRLLDFDVARDNVFVIKSDNFKNFETRKYLFLSQKAISNFVNYNVASDKDLLKIQQKIRKYMLKQFNKNQETETVISSQLL